MKKFLSFFYSMKTAIAEFILLCVVCVVASVIPQEMGAAYYERLYSEPIRKIIFSLKLDNAFVSPIFVVLIILLCLNLFLCNVTRLPLILRQYKTGGLPAINTETLEPVAEIPASKVEDLFSALRLKKSVLPDGRIYGVRGKIGLFGAWICHVGFLIIALGFAVGNFMSKEFFIQGLPGTEHKVGDTDISFTLEDFNVFLREDFTVEQFESKLTVKKGNVQLSGTSQVNHPFSAFGYRFYQNSEGWANDVIIRKNGEIVSTKTVYMGDNFEFPDIPVVVVLNQFYPDFDEMSRTSRTPLLENPHTRFAIYINGELADMNFIEIGAPITVGDITATLENPRQYSLLQVRHDPSPPIVMFGSLLVLFSLLIVFYFQLTECLAVQEEGSAKIYAFAKRNDLLFKEKILECKDKILTE